MGNSTNYTTRIGATQATNVIEVWEPEDFGPLNVDSRYDISTASKYIIKAPITIANGFDIPQTGICQIVAENRFLHPLTFTGTDGLFEMAGTSIQLLILDNLTITQTSALSTMFNVDGANAGAFQFTDCSINGGNGAIGTFSDFDRANINQVVWQNFATGMTLSNVNINMLNGPFENDVDQSIDPWITITSTQPSFLNFSSIAFFAKPNETVFNVSSGTQDAGTRIQINNCDSEDPADPGATFFDATGLDQMDPRITATANPGLTSSKIFAFGRSNGNTSTTSVTDGAYNVLSLTNLVASAATQRFTLTDADEGVWTVTSKDPFTAAIDFRCTVSKAAGGTDTFRIAPGVNGIAPTFATETNYAEFSIDGNTTVSFSAEFVLDTDVGETDTIQLYIAGDGTGDDLVFNAVTTFEIRNGV